MFDSAVLTDPAPAANGHAFSLVLSSARGIGAAVLNPISGSFP